MKDNFEVPVSLEINGTLDLHHFSPKDIKYLVPDYLDECIKRQIFEARIIHGKGRGALRRSVHAILSKLVQVESFRLAGEERGAWGATLVYLRESKSKR